MFNQLGAKMYPKKAGLPKLPESSLGDYQSTKPKTQPPLGRNLTLEEVCELGSISRSSAYNWRKAGLFPEPVKVGVRAVRYREADVLKWLEGVTAVKPKSIKMQGAA